MDTCTKFRRKVREPQGRTIELWMDSSGLTTRERQRYSRHLLLPEVGEEGQRRLKAARVLCVGASYSAEDIGSQLLKYGAAEVHFS